MPKWISAIGIVCSVLALLPGCERQQVNILPATGDYLRDSQNVSSGVVLQSVQLSKAISDSVYQYTSTAESNYKLVTKTATIGAGATIWLLTGSVQNNSEASREITVDAWGLATGGRLVSWTLASADVSNVVSLRLDAGQSASFSLRMYYSSESLTIRIFGTSANTTSP